MGLSADNVLAESPSHQLTEHLLEARLQEELRRGAPPKASENQVERDWSLLQQAMNASREQVIAEAAQEKPGRGRISRTAFEEIEGP